MLNHSFRKISIYCTVQNIENYGTHDADEKDKIMETVTAVNKSKIENSGFSICVKLWVRYGSGSGSGSASQWKIGSRR
jgi:hypothetical protein